ncbi:hypothetical protein N7582_000323 [Saccharomyces uvarum]|uniref:Uncharacterized protein n=1 Tax=Saccharomyces uvarum TaxID=230603 RepID=A0AA35JD77_SACUV|nr:hypothetical protein N7582_000323 [Saccharomyces uvarum]CAI4055407.1 hypothetical protein SUVC_02G2490 [Saccharomyces uvarum]
MFFSQVLRSSARAAPIKRYTGGRVGEAWMITESRRLIPEVFQWGAVICTCLGWPGAVYFFSKARKA